jgi:hypothetical protein
MEGRLLRTTDGDDAVDINGGGGGGTSSILGSCSVSVVRRFSNLPSRGEPIDIRDDACGGDSLGWAAGLFNACG